MFGGIGMYHGETFFAIIDDGRLYFVTDDTTRPEFESRGMKPFQYAPGKFIRTYYEVPVDVLEDDRDLSAWARDAVAAQKRRHAKRKKR
jgi:DNA transformation protein